MNPACRWHSPGAAGQRRSGRHLVPGSRRSTSPARSCISTAARSPTT